MRAGLILYGPPAAGKDTVTAALTDVDQRFEYFQRLKVGGGRTAGYRMVSATELDQKRQAGQIVYENERYGATYVVDRPGLDEIVGRGSVPVLHLGQVQA